MSYITQVTSDGCIIRDDEGQFILEVPTEEEANEWIRDNESRESNYSPIDLYRQFEIYCKKMPGRCFIDGLMANSNEKVLFKFMKAFENSRGVEILVHSDYIDGELFYFVDEVRYK